MKMKQKSIAATITGDIFQADKVFKQNSTKRRLIVLAVAGTFAAPAAALAQASSVVIYGTMNVNAQTTKAGGATAPATSVSRRDALSTDSSNIGFKGVERLGGGLSAIFQCESSANIDGQAVAGLCGRNSNVGLSGGWGTVWYGNWDTPFKAVTYGTKVGDPFLSTDVYAYQSIMSSPGFNYRSGAFVTATPSSPATSVLGFDVRAGNSVGYWTPNFGGFSGKLQFSTSEFENAAGTISPRLWGAALNYDAGPLSVLAAYERHEDSYALVAANTAAGVAFGSTAANLVAGTSKDDAWRLGAGYTFGFGTTVSVLLEQLELNQSGAAAGAVSKFDRKSWQVAASHRMGSNEFRLRYSQADEGDCALVGAAACSTDGFGAKMYALGYAYHLSKRTQVYAYYTKIRNERNAQYTLSIGGSAAVAGATPKGADPEALGLGIRHSF